MFLEIVKATKWFGGLKAVDGVDLQVRPREIAGLIGPNGAGKTTMFNLITGLERLTAGEIRFKGKPVHELPSHMIARAGIARTFQNIRLFGGLSVIDNVMLGQHARTRTGALAAALKTPAFRREERRVYETALALLHFVGLGDVATMRAADLPYGMQRRLEIARALALEPQLLLLDEPAAGMNETESRALMDLVRAIRDRSGVTVLLIEHDMRFVMGLCERITVLNFGRLLAEGTPAEIQRNEAVIEAYLGKSEDGRTSEGAGGSASAGAAGSAHGGAGRA